MRRERRYREEGKRVRNIVKFPLFYMEGYWFHNMSWISQHENDGEFD